MGFRFRLGKHKNKIIAMLLFLSIVFVDISTSIMQIKAQSQTVDFVVKTYWDVLNSIANSCGYSMEEILDPVIDDDLDLKDYAKASIVRFFNWTATCDTGFSSDELEEEFYHMVDSSTVTGLKMSQKMWDAFKMFFEEVEAKKPLPSSPFTDFEVFKQFVITNLDYPEAGFNKVLLTNSGKRIKEVYNQPMIIYSMTDSNGIYYIRFLIKTCHCEWNITDNVVTCGGNHGLSLYILDNVWNSSFSGNLYGVSSMDVTGWQLRAINDSLVDINTATKYSPYFNYKSTAVSPPSQVPVIIPWSTFPNHEVTEDDTKIYIPIDSTDNPTETPEQPTETPEEPTETPENPDDGDDITNLVPIFPDIDIDIDPDIHLPDDWINPPDIDLDPDVDVDTPSPGGKIPHLQKLKEKFPFCIPFDLVLLFKMLNKKPKAPKWEFKHDFQIGDSKPYTWEVVIDMSDYDEYVQIFREGFFLLFLVGLFFVTKKLISWQTG